MCVELDDGELTPTPTQHDALAQGRLRDEQDVRMRLAHFQWVLEGYMLNYARAREDDEPERMAAFARLIDAMEQLIREE